MRNEHREEAEARRRLRRFGSLAGCVRDNFCGKPVSPQQHYKELGMDCSMLSYLTTTSGPTKPSQYIHFISEPLLEAVARHIALCSL